MRYLIFIISFFSFTSCTLLRQSTEGKAGSTLSMAEAIDHNRQTRKFIDDIAVTPEKTRVMFVAQVQQPLSPSKGPSANASSADNSSIVKEELNANKLDPSKLTGLQIKYAELIGTEATSLPSLSLLLALEEWYGTPYLWGGTTKRGIDCSAFTKAMYQSVYGVSLPRVSRDQHHATQRIPLTNLQEGDLVFFNTRGRGVTHVGIYMGNNKFAHASTARGVVISDLNEEYYRRRYLGAGRPSADFN